MLRQKITGSIATSSTGKNLEKSSYSYKGDKGLSGIKTTNYSDNPYKQTVFYTYADSSDFPVLIKTTTKSKGKSTVSEKTYNKSGSITIEKIFLKINSR
ncbi:MAG: hypothetical protein HC906_19230 [Bacteroidales bacterium]|nr:hypothetical protein [Bacteroidales bacterium]